LATIFSTMLLLRQAGHAASMRPVDLLRRPMFALLAFATFASFGAQGLAFVALRFYFEAIMHCDPILTGFLMSAWSIVVVAAGPLAGRLSVHYQPGLLGGVGLAVLSAGMPTLGNLNSTSTAWHIMISMGICGAGFGFFQSPNLRALMTGATPGRSGGASAMIGLVRPYRSSYRCSPGSALFWSKRYARSDAGNLSRRWLCPGGFDCQFLAVGCVSEVAHCICSLKMSLSLKRCAWKVHQHRGDNFSWTDSKDLPPSTADQYYSLAARFPINHATQFGQRLLSRHQIFRNNVFGR
jgi:MFS family permease